MAKTKINRPVKLLLGFIILLILVIALFAYLNRSPDQVREGTLTVKAGGKTVDVLSIADLKKLPAVQKNMVIHSGQGNTENYFTGTSLLAILHSIDPTLTQRYKKIVTKGIDNYTSGLDMSEVMQPDNVYIVYADHGQPLTTKTGQPGSLRIIICNDDYGQRYTKWLVSLELQN